MLVEYGHYYPLATNANRFREKLIKVINLNILIRKVSSHMQAGFVAHHITSDHQTPIYTSPIPFPRHFLALSTDATTHSHIIDNSQCPITISKPWTFMLWEEIGAAGNIPCNLREKMQISHTLQKFRITKAIALLVVKFAAPESYVPSY